MYTTNNRSQKLSFAIVLSFFCVCSAKADSISVTSTGVGINEGSPVFELEVSGSAYATSEMGAYSASSSSYLVPNGIRFSASSTNTKIDHNGAGSNIQFRTKDSGGSLRPRLTIFGSSGSGKVEVNNDLIVGGETLIQDNLDVDGVVTAISYVTTSDAGTKKDIRPIENSLARLNRLKAVSFRYKKAPKRVRNGLIAQEVEKVFPESVHMMHDGNKGINYSSLIAPMIEAIQSQQHALERQEKAYRNLEKKIEALKNSKRHAVSAPNGCEPFPTLHDVTLN